MGFSLSGFLSSVGHYLKVTPSLLNRLPRKTSKTNFVCSLFHSGLQRYALFLNLQIFLQKFLNFIFLRQSFKELFLASSTTRFSNGSAKVRLFYLLPNLFLATNTVLRLAVEIYKCNILKAKALHYCYNFIKLDCHGSLSLAMT